MTACCAYGCRNRFSNKVRGITFHRFPENPEQRDAWVLAIRRKNWKPTKNTRICSAHFSEDQIDRTSHFRVRLRENAVPNIFKCSKSLKNEKNKPDMEEKVSDLSDNGTTEFCKIAVRPTKTAPLVISVKPVTSEASTCKTTTVDTSAPSDPAASTALTTLPLSIFTQVPQIITASGTPIITSPLPSILATTVGPFITTGLPQTLTIPQNLAPAITPINPSHQTASSIDNTNANDSNNSLVIQSLGTIPFQEEREVIKLRRKNEEYLKKIRTLQQTVRRQKRMIERLTFDMEVLKNSRFLDGDSLITDVCGSEESEEELIKIEVSEEAEEVSEPELRTKSPEEILP